MAVAFGATASLAAAGLASAPDTAEKLWGAVGPRIAFGLSRLTAPLPFAAVEVVVAAWLGLRLVQAAVGVAAIASRRRRAGPAVGAAALLVLRDAGIWVGLFYVLWGFGYARPPLERRREFAAAFGESHRDVARLRALAEQAVLAANEAYFALHGAEDMGRPTQTGDPRGLESAVEEGWRRVANALALEDPAGRRHGPTKRLVISPLLRFVGLAGFYSPLTGEATVNASVPAVGYAHVVAHEKAHQRGVNREDEADFLGWLAAASAPDPLARYSAAVEAERELLRALIPLDRKAVWDLVRRRHPGVQRDIDDLNAYWTPARGRAGALARRINDTYLKTNRVPDGVASYGRSVSLLIAWADRHGGRLETSSGSAAQAPPHPVDEPAR